MPPLRGLAPEPREALGSELPWGARLRQGVNRRPAPILGAALVVLAVGIRVAVVKQTQSHYVARFDSSDYVRLARAVAHGHGLPAFAPIFHSGDSAFRPPLYPLLLGGVVKLGGGVTAMRLVGSLLGGVSVALFGLLGRELWDRRAGFVAMAIAAIYPSFVLLDSVIYSEVLFVPLLLGAMVCAARATRVRSVRWAAAAGVVGGLSALERPNGFLVVIGVLVLLACRWPATRRARLAPIVVAVAAAAVVMAPWVVRNAVRMHAFIPSSDAGGFDLAGTFNAQVADSNDYPGTFVPPFAVASFEPLFADQALPEHTLNARLGRLARSYAEHHPGYVVDVMRGNSVRMFDASGPAWSQGQATLMGVSGTDGAAWFYGWWVLVGLGVLVAPWAWRRRAPAALMVLAVTFWMLGALTASGDPRYREPIEVCLLLLVSAGLATATSGWRPVIASRVLG